MEICESLQSLAEDFVGTHLKAATVEPGFDGDIEASIGAFQQRLDEVAAESCPERV